MSWKRLDEKRAIDPDFYVEEGPDAVYVPLGLCHRVYGWEGRMWPRLSLSVCSGYNHTERSVRLHEKSFKLTAAFKSQQGQCWLTLDGVPASLFDEALEMMRESKSKTADS